MILGTFVLSSRPRKPGFQVVLTGDPIGRSHVEWREHNGLPHGRKVHLCEVALRHVSEAVC